jgi:hypothetical protein
MSIGASEPGQQVGGAIGHFGIEAQVASLFQIGQ